MVAEWFPNIFKRFNIRKKANLIHEHKGRINFMRGSDEQKIKLSIPK